MPVDTTKVLLGVASVWVAPKGTAMIADTVAQGAAWTSPWSFIGATEEGVTVAKGVDVGEIRIEEQSLPVLRPVNAVTFELRFTLSEDTPETMKLSYGGGVIATIVAGVGVAGKKRLKLANNLDNLAVGFEAVNAAGLPRRLYVPSVLSVADVETAYRRATNNRSYNTVLSAVCDPSEIQIDDWTALPS